MNIAIFASAFHPSLGGVEELCRQLAHEYQRRGWRVLIVTNRWPRHLPIRESIEGIPVYRFPFRSPDSGWKSVLTYLGTTWKIHRQVARLLREEQVEIVHVQCAGINTHYAAAAAQALRLPFVLTLQGELTMDATRLFERSAFARRALRRGLKEADAVTACSAQTLAEAVQFSSAPIAAKSEVIPNGVKVADFHRTRPFEHPRPYILAIGRHAPQKGFDVLIEAFASVCRSAEWPGDLLIAGEGPETPALQGQAAALGLTGRIHFPGRASRELTARLFTGCEFFVLPSRHEPFGIVNLEAMACGKAVIASAVGGVPEFVKHGENGWLVEAGDVRALAEAISRLNDDPALRTRLGESGRKVGAAHDWSQVTDAYASVYRRVRRCPAVSAESQHTVLQLPS